MLYITQKKNIYLFCFKLITLTLYLRYFFIRKKMIFKTVRLMFTMLLLAVFSDVYAGIVVFQSSTDKGNSQHEITA